MLLFVHPSDIMWSWFVSSQTRKVEVGFCFVEPRNKAEFGTKQGGELIL